MTEIVGQIIIGWLLADLLAGIFHWWEDRCGRESWPIIGPWLVSPNRLHHIKPTAFLATSFFARNRALFVVAGLIGGALMWWLGPSVLLVTMTIGGALSAEIHAWTHKPSKMPKAIRVLQETGFFQSPKHHAGHHRPPQDKRYCPITDWLNPTLDALKVWDRMERLLDRIGLPPSRGLV